MGGVSVTGASKRRRELAARHPPPLHHGAATYEAPVHHRMHGRAAQAFQFSLNTQIIH
jgi:hypothetical protein